MTDVNQLITDHLDIWTSAIEKKSGAGRGNGGKVNLYGIKKLRELILELAVRGKLVPQNKSERQGSHALDQSLLERKGLEKVNAIRPKVPALRKDSEWPFSVPTSWVWATLSQAADFKPGKTPSTKNTIYWSQDSAGLPWVSISDLNANGSVSETAKCVTEIARKEVFKKDLVPIGTLLMSFKLTIGKVSVLDVAAYHNEAIVSVRPFKGVERDYLFRFLPLLSKFASDKAAIKGNTLNADSLSLLPIPIPPTAEQRRIVAKVDELMGLCDALETQAEDSYKAHQALVETCLATLTNSQSPEDLAQNWTRIETHFDTLFTTEESVSHLKEVVLQLGVRGRLLPQNQDDEDASVLLKGLLQDRSKNMKRGRGAVGYSTTVEPPFLLADNWVWHQFGDLVEFQSELVKPDGYQDFFQVAPDMIEKGTGKLVDQRTVRESGIRGPNNRFYTGQLLYSKIRPSLSKAVIAPYDGLCSADMYPLKPLIDPDFLLLSILSEDFLMQVRKLENRIKMPKLNVGSLSSIYIAVPPLAEQSRIVEKVKSMFRLCDKMREKIETSQQCNIEIADTLTSQIH